MDEMNASLEKLEEERKFRSSVGAVIRRRKSIDERIQLLSGVNLVPGPYTEKNPGSLQKMRKELNEKEKFVKEYINHFTATHDVNSNPELAELLGVKEVATQADGTKTSTTFQRPTVSQHLEPMLKDHSRINELVGKMKRTPEEEKELEETRKKYDIQMKRLGRKWYIKLQMDKIMREIEEIRKQLKQEGLTPEKQNELRTRLGKLFGVLEGLRKEYAQILNRISDLIGKQVEKEQLEKYGVKSFQELQQKAKGEKESGTRAEQEPTTAKEASESIVQGKTERPINEEPLGATAKVVSGATIDEKAAELTANKETSDAKAKMEPKEASEPLHLEKKPSIVETKVKTEAERNPVELKESLPTEIKVEKSKIPIVTEKKSFWQQMKEKREMRRNFQDVAKTIADCSKPLAKMEEIQPDVSKQRETFPSSIILEEGQYNHATIKEGKMMFAATPLENIPCSRGDVMRGKKALQQALGMEKEEVEKAILETLTKLASKRFNEDKIQEAMGEKDALLPWSRSEAKTVVDTVKAPGDPFYSSKEARRLMMCAIIELNESRNANSYFNIPAGENEVKKEEIVSTPTEEKTARDDRRHMPDFVREARASEELSGKNKEELPKRVEQELEDWDLTFIDELYPIGDGKASITGSEEKKAVETIRESLNPEGQEQSGTVSERTMYNTRFSYDQNGKRKPVEKKEKTEEGKEP